MMNHSVAAALITADEPFGAGLCELPGAPAVRRYARAYRRALERTPLPAYNGGTLYPCGLCENGSEAVKANYSRSFVWDCGRLDAKTASAEGPMRAALETLRETLEREQALVPNRNSTPPRHTVGGNAYTHCIVRYDRVLAEGLDGYGARVEDRLRKAESEESTAFYLAMRDLLIGVRTRHERMVDSLRSAPDTGQNRLRLLDSLARVPFQPARSLYEAMVSYNFVYYLDGCDNPGRMDQVLLPYYRGEEDEADAVATISDFADNVSANAGWSSALGGTGPTGEPAYNELTEIVLRATRGRYRPSLELRVRRDMPDSVWAAAFDALASGNGQPAFYHEEAYLQSLREADLGVPESELTLWNGGGCTETMLHGCSNVGSLDAGFNLPLILSESLARSLEDGVSFEAVLRAFESDARREIRDTLGNLNEHFVARARNRPQPVRSLLVDDCIDRGRDFNDGGARYNWSVVNVAGLANVADALEALRIVVFEQAELSPREMHRTLAADFRGQEALRQRLSACPKFGNDIASVDALARRVAETVYDEIRSFPCARGGRFLPSHIMFETFARSGSAVGALPDGRRAGEPLADSTGPVQGRDRSGPTAMLKSVAGLPLSRAVGTPVLNLRLAKSTVRDEEGRRRLRALIEGYFSMGGMQLQVSLLDQAELEDALIHPEHHEDLIVRIGGYSVHFNRLSPELKREVIKRTAYTV